MADDSILSSEANPTKTPDDGDIVVEAPEIDVQANLVREFGQGVNGDAGAISNGDLPWTPVLLPTTSAGIGGVGVNQHNLQVGSWVFGIFADPDDMQLPLILGTISGGPGGGTSGGSGTTSGSSTDTSGTATQNVTLTAAQKSANTEQVWKKLISMGYTPVQAAGIMGNLEVESPGFNTRAVGDGGKARGIAQWHPDRFGPLQRYASSKNADAYDLNIQLEFVKKELETNESKAGRLLANATTPEDAASAFCAFERPKGYVNAPMGQDGSRGVPSIGRRRGLARAFYNQFTSQPASTTPSTSTNNRMPNI